MLTLLEGSLAMQSRRVAVSRNEATFQKELQEAEVHGVGVWTACLLFHQSQHRDVSRGEGGGKATKNEKTMNSSDWWTMADVDVGH